MSVRDQANIDNDNSVQIVEEKSANGKVEGGDRLIDYDTSAEKKAIVAG